jgi:hypothetical protein
MLTPARGRDSLSTAGELKPVFASSFFLSLETYESIFPSRHQHTGSSSEDSRVSQSGHGDFEELGNDDPPRCVWR